MRGEEGSLDWLELRLFDLSTEGDGCFMDSFVDILVLLGQANDSPY